MDLCEPAFDQGNKTSFVLFLAFPIIVLGLYHIVDEGNRTLFGINGSELGKNTGVVFHIVVEQMLYECKLIVEAHLKIFG